MRMRPSGDVNSVAPARARAAVRARERVVPVRREVRDRRAARSLEKAKEARSQGKHALSRVNKIIDTGL